MSFPTQTSIATQMSIGSIRTFEGIYITIPTRLTHDWFQKSFIAAPFSRIDLYLFIVQSQWFQKAYVQYSSGLG
jgi:hypothetical protein